MFSPLYISVCIYCMIQLGFLTVMDIRRRNARSGQEKYFLWMLVITLFSFAADIISSSERPPDWFFPFSAAGVYAEIILNTLLLPIFYSYICAQISDLDPALKKRLNIVLWILAAACAALIISTAFTGTIFYFDSNKIYHRGRFFLIPMFILFAMMIIIEVFLISQKKKIEAGYFRSLLFFLIFPLIGWMLQSIIFGLPFSLLGVTLAAQIVFTNIQNRNIDKDYLTGAFTRQTLDSYMQRKIDKSGSRTFSAILLDIDNFKTINDSFGHYEGDVALVNAVRLLRDSVGRTDFIARYGGDEFCVILDSDNPNTIETAIRRIRNRLVDYNRNSNRPYQLDFSMGYAVYQLSIGKKAESFYKVIDRKMYEEKNTRRAAADRIADMQKDK